MIIENNKLIQLNILVMRSENLYLLTLANLSTAPLSFDFIKFLLYI